MGEFLSFSMRMRLCKFGKHMDSDYDCIAIDLYVNQQTNRRRRKNTVGTPKSEGFFSPVDSIYVLLEHICDAAANVDQTQASSI